MIRLDALARRLDAGKKDEPVGRMPHIELNASDHEEPTWEVSHPGEERRRRLDGRTRTILSLAAAAAIVVNAGAAWVYWRITGSQTGPVASETVVELALRARSDLNRPLRSGQPGNLIVTVTNEYNFPIRITSVAPGSGNAVADDEHRDAGCREPRVQLTQPRFAVSWEVPRNTIGAFTIPDGLVMQSDGGGPCGGAVFTVPVQASGVSRQSP